MTEQNIMYVYLYVEINKSTDVSNCNSSYKLY